MSGELQLIYSASQAAVKDHDYRSLDIFISAFSRRKKKGVIPLDLCFIVSNSNIETTNLGIMGNQKCHVPTLKYILYYITSGRSPPKVPTRPAPHEPDIGWGLLPRIEPRRGAKPPRIKWPRRTLVTLRQQKSRIYN